MDPLQDLYDLIERAIVEEPPIVIQRRRHDQGRL